MANVRVVQAIRNARLDAIKTQIDSGGSAGTIKLYSGTQPANADAALGSNTILGTLTFAFPSAPAASAGVLAFNTITQDVSADATNVATWARIASSSAATVFDCDVGQGAGFTIILNTTSIVAGGPIQISSFQLTDAAS